MISNINPTEWLRFCADDETGRLDPEPHQVVDPEEQQQLPALLQRQAA